MEYNILIGNYIGEGDKELFFGPLTSEDKFETVPESYRWPQLIKHLAIWKSTSEAVRNGWNKDIEEGFSDKIIGKRKTRVTILKATKRIEIPE